ncbi:ThiJ/PfpI family protein [Ophiocordyceps camponoti-floridani]|uniref:D-lactate dehydratase n=1 Tax=Ophiocordyceps camponoti-floridani TaxID=2030778 RepID=A0A8H4QEX5_9HYPO|nr:ThiJ/PfpI family protein [Ophiocordyceps camponoti-floridani]
MAPKRILIVLTSADKIVKLDKPTGCSCTDFLDKHADVYKKTRKLSDVSAADFDAVFYPGGHGPMYDLVDDAHSIRLIEEFYRAGKPVASVCHGPIVLVRCTVDGKPLLQGRRVTGFTNEEEKAVGLLEAMPMLLEDEAKKCGCEWKQAGEAWGECVVVDGTLITGQNPASAKGVGEALAKALGV